MVEAEGEVAAVVEDLMPAVAGSANNPRKGIWLLLHTARLHNNTTLLRNPTTHL